MNHNELIEILRVGLQAVSPYNSQPWEFQYHNDQLLISPRFNERGLLGNVRNVIIYSLGAFLENLSEGAKHFHYTTEYELIGSTISSGKLLCRVTFSKSSDSGYYDINHVMTRHTNRKSYFRETLPDNVFEKIRSGFNDDTREVLNLSNNHIFIENYSMLERVRVANTEFNEELLDILCFTPQEAATRRRGLDIRTLELPLIAQLHLKAERNLFFRKILGQGLIAQHFAQASRKESLYRCPLLVAFKNHESTIDVHVRDWIYIQRILNSLNKDGLRTHVLAASADLLKIKRSFYLPKERKILDQADINIEESIGTNLSSILCLLRVGHADDSKVKSLRVDPQDLFSNRNLQLD